MRGKSIYLTNNEILALTSTCSEWESMMNEGEETAHLVDERLDEGLGSAMKKLYSGREGQKVYENY